jgi:hypothetical protein
MSGLSPTAATQTGPGQIRTGITGSKHVIRKLVLAYLLVAMVLATAILVLRIETPHATTFSWEKVAYCSPPLPRPVRVSLWFHELSPRWWDGVKYAIFPWAALVAWLGLRESRFFELAFWSLMSIGLALSATDILTYDVLVRHSPVSVPAGPSELFGTLMRTGIFYTWGWGEVAAGLIVYHPVLLMLLAWAFRLYTRSRGAEDLDSLEWPLDPA